MERHVLVPIDGSTHSERAFDYALEELPGAAMTIVHVIDPAGAGGYEDDDENFDLEGYRREGQRRRERAEEMLATYRDRAADGGVDVETVVAIGRPAGRILEMAADRDVDHIVLGSRGRSGVGRILFGSVAEAVTRRAPVPVTIVR